MDEVIVRGAKIELARREFFYFCQLKAPDFYKDDRTHLAKLCNEFQEFSESQDDVLIIAMPPRHGKSRTAGNFVEWLLGKDKTKKIMTGSYNETLSTVFSKNVRDSIMEEKADANRIVFSDIFPGHRIKQGDGAMNLWSLEGGYNNYLATSPKGTATGFGADYLIIDDLIKSAEEAFNARVLAEHWSWFTNTMLSRLEECGKIIIIMTRWATEDLAGKALKAFQEDGKKVRYVVMKALQENGEMLCPTLLSYKSYLSKTRHMAKEIALANYQQEPIDVKGRLYTRFKTYDRLPLDSSGKPLFTAIKNYTDTADKGEDYLCSITYGEYEKEAYLLDVYYTKDPMEVTEPETAKRLMETGCTWAKIEANNGGRGFARNVERLLLQGYHSNRCRIEPFTQSQNKQARILTNSTWVMDHIYFPVNWADRWPEYFDSMVRYQKEGKNEHDDAQDATTGVAEQFNKTGGTTIGGW
ncbi:phage terminase large subunit [Holdemania massiliensis]|uniref:phage terminase large subunit n=1 Tax=Holdemania massiliensis TaxID=1468449 RepID=UPI001F0624B1|nr:phage terminase large subunit [Holdemania massiliensis]MCH1940520.1 phage terminase large subunit [Holdemania massiliensis]